MKTKNVLIADDHVIIRRGLKYLLNTSFSRLNIFETDTMKGVIDIMEHTKMTHLILDMQMQDGNIIEVFSQIKTLHPEVRSIIYTMSAEEIFGKRMLQLGADGFISKLSSEQEIVKAFGLFFDDKKYISSKLQEQLSSEHQEKTFTENPIEKLSDREIIVLNYLLKGEGVKNIAGHLNIKINTVATFKARLFNKLGVSNIIDLRNLTELYNYQSS